MLGRSNEEEILNKQEVKESEEMSIPQHPQGKHAEDPMSSSFPIINFDLSDVYMESLSYWGTGRIVEVGSRLKGNPDKTVLNTVAIPPLTKEKIRLFKKTLNVSDYPFHLIIHCREHKVEDIKSIIDTLTEVYYPSKAIIDLHLNEEFCRDRKLIGDLTKHLMSGQCHPGLRVTFDFGNTKMAEELADIFAKVLASGHCPKNLKISCDAIDARGLRKILQSLKGKCPAGLALIFKQHMFFEPSESDERELYNELRDALTCHCQGSCDCPKDLTYSVHETKQSESHLSTLFEVLESKKTSPDLTVYFSNASKSTVDRLSDILKSGKRCDESLTLGFDRPRDNSYLFRQIAKILQTGQCPIGFGLILSLQGISRKDIGELAKAFQHMNCPTGVRLKLTDSNKPTLLKHFFMQLEDNRTLISIILDSNVGYTNEFKNEVVVYALLRGCCVLTDLQPVALQYDTSLRGIEGHINKMIIRNLKRYPDKASEEIILATEKLLPTVLTRIILSYLDLPVPPAPKKNKVSEEKKGEVKSDSSNSADVPKKSSPKQFLTQNEFNRIIDQYDTTSWLVKNSFAVKGPRSEVMKALYELKEQKKVHRSDIENAIKGPVGCFGSFFPSRRWCLYQEIIADQNDDPFQKRMSQDGTGTDRIIANIALALR